MIEDVRTLRDDRALDVFVPGLPIPQGSTRAFAMPGGRGARIVHANGDKLGLWRTAVTVTCHGEWGGAEAIDGPAVVVVDFYLPRPKSTPKRVTAPAKKPDLDKLGRAILDALTDASVLTDDARVVTLTLAKFFASERWPMGARIHVRPTDRGGRYA